MAPTETDPTSSSGEIPRYIYLLIDNNGGCGLGCDCTCVFPPPPPIVGVCGTPEKAKAEGVRRDLEDYAGRNYPGLITRNPLTWRHFVDDYVTPAWSKTSEGNWTTGGDGRWEVVRQELL